MTLQDGIFQSNLLVRGSNIYRYKLLFGLSLPFPAPHSRFSFSCRQQETCCVYVFPFVCLSVSERIEVLLNRVLFVHLCAFSCVGLYEHVLM